MQFPLLNRPCLHSIKKNTQYNTILLINTDNEPSLKTDLWRAPNTAAAQDTLTVNSSFTPPPNLCTERMTQLQYYYYQWKLGVSDVSSSN